MLIVIIIAGQSPVRAVPRRILFEKQAPARPKSDDRVIYLHPGRKTPLRC